MHRRSLQLFALPVLALLAAGSEAALRDYGRLSGSVVRTGIDNDYTGTRHYEVHVNAPAPAGSCATWRVDVNLQNVEHRIVVLDTFAPAWSNAFPAKNGYTALPYGSLAQAGRGALDYMRHPGLLDAIEGRTWSASPLIQGSGTTATAPALDQWIRGARRVHAYGESFSNNAGTCVQRGVHNIHQNQGSTRASAGSWQDGGLVVEHERWVPLFSPINWQIIGWTSYIETSMLMTRFRDQTDLADRNGRPPAASGVVGGRFDGSERFGPFNADQIVFRATALQLSLYDPRFEMRVVDASGQVIAESNGPDHDGVVEFARTYRAGPVWVDVDTAWGSHYEFRHDYAWE